MAFFKDREAGPRARTETTIAPGVQRAIAALVRRYRDKEAFGIDYPSICPDGNAPDGTDKPAFDAALEGVVPGMADWLDRPLHREAWLDEDTASEGAEPARATTGDILDTLEWLFAHVGQPQKGRWHEFFRHYHLDWDRKAGQSEFREAVNAIFARNGLAYEMDTEGRIHRLVEGPDFEALAKAGFETGDSELDALLERAQRSFLARDADAGQRSIEALWDAFERLKTLEDPTDKKASAGQLVAKISGRSETRVLIEREMLTLTEIGNTWRIRHHEVGKPDLAPEPALREYLFLRMFGLVRFLLAARKARR